MNQIPEHITFVRLLADCDPTNLAIFYIIS
jgi:hypothetical protein